MNLWLLAGAGLALLAGACSPAVPQPSGGASPAPPRVERLKPELAVATLYSVTNSQIFVARGAELLSKELGSNVKVDLRGYPDGNQIMSAFRNGELDIAYVGSVPALTSFVQKPNFRVIGGTNLGGTVLVARGDRNINTIADLKGRTVAVPGVGNFQDVMLRASILPRAGLEASADPDPARVRVVTSAPVEMLARLKEGSIDAAIAFEPWPSRILLDTSLNSKVLVDWNQVWRDGKYPSSVLIASTQLIEDYPDTVRRFLRAHVAATLLATTNPEQAQRLLYEQILALQGVELPLAVIASGFPRSQPTYDPNAEAVIESARLIRSLYPNQMAAVPGIREFFDLTLLNEALKEKGLPSVSP
ncbi:MAG: ABC transporter substrate-binding protein [Chloroflexi bacterium]|nr:ABC transporter substrate-binding protein [Chloroflexota bacterium]